MTFFGTPIPAWNKDNDLKSAIQNSTIWYYVKLAERIGRENYRVWLKKCRYGNGDLSEKGTDFWNFGHFGVSPIEQVRFLKAFYEEKLPFSKRTYQIAKRVMMTEMGKQISLLSKTGWTKADGQDIGWYVGYYKMADNIYFFATRLQKDTATVNPEFASCRKTITLSILKKSGLKL
jgi:beta-lactamase class D